MRNLCPNLERDDVLETVLEVPIPEEMLSTNKSRVIRPQIEKNFPINARTNMEIQFLLGVIGAPLIPYPIRCDRTFNDNIKGHPIEISMAKYIVQQYIAASGGDHALNAMESMYAMGKVKMSALDLESVQDFSRPRNTKKLLDNMKHSGLCEVGAFVLWQKRPDLWNLELMVSGCKISAGSDGTIAWRQTPWQSSHASRGPPRPLRRLLQGLDPRSTANLFTNSICIGEKTVNNEDCFVLKLDSEPSALRTRSSGNVEIMKHTVWGCFSQRTGLLIQLKDSHLLRIKVVPGNSSVFWETTMESSIRDYRTINGVNVAHGGKTCVSLLKFGEDSSKSRTRTRMEEVWSVEEVDFNVKGLSPDCFLPPADLRSKVDDGEFNGKVMNYCYKTKSGGYKHVSLASSARIVPVQSKTAFETP